MPGQKIGRASDNQFLEKVKNERIRRQDSNTLNNYCAVQVDFGQNHRQEAINFSVKGSSFSVGYHSEVRAIANCINQEIERSDSIYVDTQKIDLAADGDEIAKKVEFFFAKNPGCSVIGYSDRQPCKEPSFAESNPYQGCERFLQKILPEDQHKIDYSFEYLKIPAHKQDGTLIPGHFQYKYADNTIKELFQQELRASAAASTPKPKITYFKPKATLPVVETIPLPADTNTHFSSVTDMSKHLEELTRTDLALWQASSADPTTQSTQATEPALQDQTKFSHEGVEVKELSTKVESSSDDEPPKSKPKPELVPKPKAEHSEARRKR